MKKILPTLVLIGLLAVLVVPLIVSAVEEPAEMAGKCTLRHDFSAWTKVDCPAADKECLFSSTQYDCPTCCVLDTIYSVTDWIFIFVLSLVVIFVLIGAFYILTAAGSPEKMNTGRSYIIWAIVGALVAALAKAVPTIVKALLRLG
jgi:hypothetical protein